ncbi:tRNA-2-methylthio-N(6)-dimethylallyladenosine synthase [uncultured archaeon]|nr:tRNA-2-methylthio-N(6)-dimethylallyladenosine synthase [uncultured archaeon]
MAKIVIETYGCALNQAEGEIMGSLLEREGHAVRLGKHADNDACDCLIVNTCTVKTPTEQRILDRLRKLQGMGSRLIVAGCMASADTSRVERAAPSAGIVGVGDIGKIADAVANSMLGRRARYLDHSRTDKLEMYDARCSCGRSVVATIAVCDGCLGSCSFCESRFARGALSSFSEKLILDAVKTKIENGAKEIRLTAEDVGAYGIDKNTNIAELIAKVAEIPGKFRIRIGMLNPEHVPKYMDELIEAYRHDKVYKFIHLPIQSASDRVLRDMNRKYTVDEFDAIAKEMRGKIPKLSIETDIIVGYPTETEHDYAQTVDWLRKTRPMMVNLSRFGARPHAPASRLPQLKEEEVRRRSNEMTKIMREVMESERRKLVGESCEVLVTEGSGQTFTGRSPGYVQVALQGDHVIGDFVSVRVTGSTPLCLIGSQSDNERV